MTEESVNWNYLRETIITEGDRRLKAPYTEEEVNKVLSENGIQIPQQLYNYLTKVSRQIMYSDYSNIFSLKGLPNKKDTSYTFKSDDINSDYIFYERFIYDKIVKNIKNYEKGIFKLDIINTIEEEIYNDNVDDFDIGWYGDRYCKENNINKDTLDSSLISIIKYTCAYYRKVIDNFVRLEEHGCDSSIEIFLGEGEYYGSVWHIDRATESFLLEYKFFNDYFNKKYLNKIVPKYNNDESQQSLNIEMTATCYKTLLIMSGIKPLYYGGT